MDEIQKLHETLQSTEDTDPLYTGDKLKQLRNRVWFVMERMNATLDIFLVYGVYGFIEPSLNVIQRAKGGMVLEKVFSGLSFGAKINKATELGLLVGENKSKYLQINKIRNHFAHPESHKDKIKHYSTKTGELEVLKKLVQALDHLNNHFQTIPEDSRPVVDKKQ